jgi:multidrug efflux system membrane fusion protein
LKRRGVISLAIAILISAALIACQKGNTASNTRNSKGGGPGVGGAVPVGVATVKQRDFPVYLTGLGSVQAFNTVSLKSRVDGQIMQVNFQEGQDVHKGELLIVIDERPFQVALDQAQANLQRDQAQLANAKAQFERNKALYEGGVIAKQDLDTLQASLGQYEGTIAADKAAIDQAKLNLVYCRIISPIDGRVGLRQVDPGNYVTAASSTALLVITQLHPIAVIFTLPEDQLQAVLQQLRRGPMQVDVYGRDDQTKLSAGRLLTIDNQIDQTTGTAKLKAIFENPENSLWPNEFVNVHLLLETRKDAITAPAAAVQRGPQGNFTYVVDSSNTVKMQPVQIALTQGNTVVIASGLQAGDRVVTDGQEKLQAGSKVQPQAPQQQGGQSRNAQVTEETGSQS